VKRLVAGRFTIVKPLYRPDTFHASVQRGKRHVAIECVSSVDGRLRDAVAAACELDHPHLWRVLELVEGPSDAAIVMELVDGAALADRIRLGPIEPVQTAALLGQLLGALSCAHAAGTVHGALTANDVMIDRTGNVKLAIDLRSEAGATPRDDLRAVGALAYAMLAGDASGAIDLSRVPPKFRSWIRRCSSRLSPFRDAADAAYALQTLPEAPLSRVALYAGALAAVTVAGIALWLSRDTSAQPANPLAAQVMPRATTPTPTQPIGDLPPLPTGAELLPFVMPPRGTPVAQRTFAIEELPAIAEVRFSSESTWIEDAAVLVLQPVYRDLVQNPLLRIEISGHSSVEGDETRNRQRSLWRALAVKNYLVGLGIEEDRIVTVARGSTQPIDSNDTADGRARNRRAEIRLLAPAN
jgi:outer membrane protein OmpA-like peptidoglycan-associated protein